MLLLLLSPFTAVFFFNDTATTEIYTLSLHDALPISRGDLVYVDGKMAELEATYFAVVSEWGQSIESNDSYTLDRKSTRLNSSHLGISYAVFCLKKKKRKPRRNTTYYQSII